MPALVARAAPGGVGALTRPLPSNVMGKRNSEKTMRMHTHPPAQTGPVRTQLDAGEVLRHLAHVSGQDHLGRRDAQRRLHQASRRRRHIILLLLLFPILGRLLLHHGRGVVL